MDDSIVNIYAWMKEISISSTSRKIPNSIDITVPPPVSTGPYLPIMKMMHTMHSIWMCPASMLAKSRMVSETGFTSALKNSISASNTLSLRLTGCSSADWGHTGGTYFGYYADNGTKGYLWCEEADVLPPGDIYLGTYGGRSPVELNLRGHSQTVERLHLQNASSTVVAGSGTPALKFASANARIDSTCAATAPTLSVPAITVAAGATLTVDKVAVTVASSFSNLGTITYANGGSLSATLGVASDTIGLSATAPLTGATRLVKNGAGTYSYAGDAALDVGVVEDAGAGEAEERGGGAGFGEVDDVGEAIGGEIGDGEGLFEAGGPGDEGGSGLYRLLRREQVQRGT